MTLYSRARGKNGLMRLLFHPGPWANGHVHETLMGAVDGITHQSKGLWADPRISHLRLAASIPMYPCLGL